MIDPKELRRALDDYTATWERECAAGKSADGVIRLQASMLTTFKRLDEFFADPRVWPAAYVLNRGDDLHEMNRDYHQLKTKILKGYADMVDDMMLSQSKPTAIP